MSSIRHILILVCAMFAVTTMAQRRITPVANPENKRPETETPVVKEVKPGETPVRPASVIETRDMEGRVVLVDTISGVEYHDTITVKAPPTVYPRFTAVSVGVNVWDALARLTGQQYGVGGVWAELSIHNWFKPIVEFGFGMADYMPKDESYRYKSGMAPYFKIGLNYNFLYNSTPDYSVYLGLRYGISSFSYRIEDVTAVNGYWDESTTLSVPSQHATAGYFEFLFGLRVQIWRNISLGWELRVHKLLHQGTHLYGDPWYIPGFGTDGSLFSGAFSVSYTLPLQRTSKKSTISEREN